MIINDYSNPDQAVIKDVVNIHCTAPHIHVVTFMPFFVPLASDGLLKPA